MVNKSKIALLIDAENYKEPMSMFNQFSYSLSSSGLVVKKIAFGAWGQNKYLNSWKEVCLSESIHMEGLQGYRGKNAADKSLILTATRLLQNLKIDTLAIYSRDCGFSLVFPVWKNLGAKIIVPKYRNEFIPDADQYIQTSNIKHLSITPTSDFGHALKSALSNKLANKKY